MSGKKMMDMSENLLFLPSNILKEISDVITKAEVNLLLEDAVSNSKTRLFGRDVRFYFTDMKNL